MKYLITGSGFLAKELIKELIKDKKSSKRIKKRKTLHQKEKNVQGKG